MSEMLGICRDIRIIPMVDLDANKTELIGSFIDYFRKNYRVEIVNTDYEFRRGDISY